MKTRISKMLCLFLCLILSITSFAQTRQYYDATLNPDGIAAPATTITPLSFISYGEIENDKITLRDLEAGEDGVFTFRFSNLDNTDDVRVRFADEIDSGVYYRFRFNSGGIELAYDDGTSNNSITLPSMTTKNNNILRLERCGGQIIWREQDDVIRLSSGNDGSPLIAVVEPSATTTNVMMSVEFEPNATICDKCAMAGGTDLCAGDLMFVGYDNQIPLSNTNSFAPEEADRLLIRNQVTLHSGTSFTISKANYQSGEEWVAGDVGQIGYAPAAIASQRITYIGADNVAIGSVICFEMGSNANEGFLAQNFRINGVISNDFCVKNIGNTEQPKINIAASGTTPTALFLQQGDWKFTDNYGIFCGKTLSGLQYGALWGSANASNVPNDIDCIEIQADDDMITSATGVFNNSSIQPAASDQYQEVLTKIIALQSGNELQNWTEETGNVPDLACTDNTLNLVASPNESPFSNLNIYPNPFSETFQVEFDLSETQTVDFSLVDINGRLVYQSLSTDVFTAGHHQLELTPNLPPNRMGLLTLRIITSNSVTVRKVIYQTPTGIGQPTTIFGRG